MFNNISCAKRQNFSFFRESHLLSCTHDMKSSKTKGPGLLNARNDPVRTSYPLICHD